MSDIVTRTSVTTPTDGVGETAAFTEDQIEKYEITPEELQASGQESSGQDDSAKIAGKFNSNEELERAYLELEKKMHSPSDDVQQEQPAEEAPATEENQQNIKSAFDDLMKSGELTDEVVQKFEAAGIPREMVEKVAELEEYKADKQVAEIQNAAGSVEEYKELLSWASTNLPEEEIDTFNSIVEKGTHQELKFAVTNLSARKNGGKAERQSNLIKADSDASSPSEFGYKSQAHMLADIGNPLYKTDPSFRDRVLEKASKSNF